MENQVLEQKEVELPPDPSRDLAHLRLRIGDSLQLQFVGEESRFPVRLIGSLENRSIIVTTPVYNRRLVPVRAGQSVNIRMMMNDRACAFVTTVIHNYRTPYPHLHLEYPTELVTNQLRKAVRVITKVEASVINTSIGDRGRQIDCHLVDISETGTHLVTPIRIGKSGDQITLSLHLNINGIKRTLVVPSILRGRMKIKEDSDVRRVHYGVEFLPLSDDAKIEMTAFVYYTLSATL
jgi:c-di-GMP-binding flagellar brake protein YcgR